MKNLIPFILMSSSLIVPLVANASVRSIGDKPLLQTILPFQKWSEKGPSVVGLLNTGHLGLCEIDWMLSPSLCNPEYFFNFEGDSPNAVYFESKGEGINFLHNWPMGGAIWDAAKFTPGTQNSFGLVKDVHLVRTGVNGGRGSHANSIHFIATNVEVLDKTPEYPIDPSLAVHLVVDRYRDPTNSVPYTEVETRLHKKLEEIKGRIPDLSTYQTHRANSGSAYSLTWMNESKVLRVIYYQQLEDTYQRSEPRECGRVNEPRDCATFTTFTSEFAEQTDFDVRGNLIEQKEFPIVAHAETTRNYP